MKKFFGIVLGLILLNIGVHAQGFGLDASPKVKWSSEVEYLENGGVAIKVVARIDSGWHIYSPYTPPNDFLEGGTSFDFDQLNPQYELSDILEESKPHIAFEEVFESDVWTHEGEASFVQTISPKTKEKFKVKVVINGQVCQDNGQCQLMPEQVLEVEVDGGKVKKESLLWLFWTGMIAGFLALLTPCVFPMIPMTVTFFTKMSESKSKGIGNALLYGVSIIVIYVALGFGVTALVSEEVMYGMASSVTFNMIFFVVFVVFAISFLGYFEITLPSSFANKMDAKADKGGLIGIFFMAFTLTIVSFSCTGPVVGTLLVEAAVEGGVRGPLMGMLGFGTALALPFTLFAIFPNWLNKLPKSGGWLNSVKVVLGLLEAALALKFLSNADLVYQFGLIKRETFIIIWIVIFLVMGLYLLGVIKFPHDSKVRKLGVGKVFFATATIAFVIYLSTGLFGNSLNKLSGILPPTFYSFSEWSEQAHGKKDSYNKEGCPANLNCFHDYDQALAYAKKVNKPILVDFTGWTCVNCRTVEQSVWTIPDVNKAILDNYVLVSLYVDDKSDLEENEVYTSARNGNEITTVGDKWLDMEVSRYGKISQPLYVLLDTNEQKLVPPRSFTLSGKKYKAFLDAGLLEFNKRMAGNLEEQVENDTIN